MKKLLFISLSLSIFFFSTVLYACGDSSSPVVLPEEEEPIKEVPSAKGITDMALIYHTYEDRPKWVSGELNPFLFRQENNKLEWLFDGFLFLEIYLKKDGLFYDYGIALDGRTPPKKTEWQYLLDETFSKGRGPNALEISLDSLALKGHYPPYKRQVMFAIPNPQYGQKNWGMVDGKSLDFTKHSDRLIAAKWYVDELLKIWDNNKYKHLDFAGFYWLHETIDGAPNNDAALIKDVAAYLKTKDIDMCWIPYNWAEGVEQWREYGFSITYQQPNYFFDLNSELWILERAINFAKEQGLALEMEFDDRLLSNRGYLARYHTYIDEFEKGGVWRDKPVAYYHGTAAWLKMSRSLDPDIKLAFKKLADILVERQGKFSTIIKHK